MGERRTGSDRLRGAGAGSAVGGLCLGLLSLVASFPVASMLVLGAGIVGGLAARTDELPTQLFVGIGAIGMLGLIESSTGFGIGITALQLAAFAVVLGLADVAAGAITGHFRKRAE